MDGKKAKGPGASAGRSSDTTERGEGEGREMKVEGLGGMQGRVGDQASLIHAVAAHSKRQSSKIELEPAQSFVDSRAAVETLMPARFHQSYQQPRRSSADSPRHSLSPSNAPLESEYGRKRQREILVEEERRRSLSRSNRLSFDER